MKTQGERKDFSQRLIQALREAHYFSDSPTHLAREFNLRFDGKPVTIHASRKWLLGESIPTQEKIRVLSEWLGVTAEWLRFGSEKIHSQEDSTESFHFESNDIKLISDLRTLDEYHRGIACEFIHSLAKMSQQSKEPT